MWTSTTDVRRRPAGGGAHGPAPVRVVGSLGRGRRSEAGFSLVEVLVALSLAVCLALAVAPLWTSSQALAAKEGDAAVWGLQARIAAARWEKDVRCAGFARCPFGVASSVLQAGPKQVVLLVQASETGYPILVEWELVNGALMRRWGMCPEHLPGSFPHSLYSDSKTMLEDVDTAASAFSFMVAGVRTEGAVSPAELPHVETMDACFLGRSGRPAAGCEWRAGASVGV